MEMALLEEGVSILAGPIRRFGKGDRARVLAGPHAGFEGVVTGLVGTGEFVRVKNAEAKVLKFAQRELEKLPKAATPPLPAQCAR